MVRTMDNVKTIIKYISILIFCSFINSSYALDNPDAPNFINLFKKQEKPLLDKIENASGTRATILAYHEYNLFLKSELNKTYISLLEKIPDERKTELADSQNKWKMYRDLEFKFINNNWNRTDFGSSFSVSRGDYTSTIIRNRLIQLLHYLQNY